MERTCTSHAGERFGPQPHPNFIEVRRPFTLERAGGQVAGAAEAAGDEGLAS